jgi:hypothetical protein
MTILMDKTDWQNELAEIRTREGLFAHTSRKKLDVPASRRRQGACYGNKTKPLLKKEVPAQSAKIILSGEAKRTVRRLIACAALFI